MTEPIGDQGDKVRARIPVAMLLIIIAFGVFTLRLFYLQILEGEDLLERSRQNWIRQQRFPAPRGDIFDRDGRLLATTRPSYRLHGVPADLRRAGRTYDALADMLDVPLRDLRRRVSRNAAVLPYQPVLLRSDLDYETLARIEAHRFALPGVDVTAFPRRHYPYGELAAHLLGTLGEIGPVQLRGAEHEGYRPGDVTGQTGIERSYEKHLRGRAGGRNVEVDADGREINVINALESEPGGALVLALDQDLQQRAEAAFAEVPEGEEPHIGAAVVLDVRNGDVLVLASSPAYDPGEFADIDPQRWAALKGDPRSPLHSRAHQSHYPPGSVHKAVVAVALLEEGVIDETSTVLCPGYYHYGNRDYRCWRRRGHGKVNLRTALKESCDVFFYHFGVQLGIDRLARYARGFGLGRRSGIELPGEAPGLVPTSAWKQAQRGEPWQPGETLSAVIGQGFYLYSPLQLAVAYAALANGGIVLKPRLVLHTGRTLEAGEPVPASFSRVEISPEHMDMVRDGLVAVVEERRGTGRRARVAGVRVAGKTGTAQVVGIEHTEGMEEDEIPRALRDHAWFAAFAPAGAPEIAVAVFVEHGLSGGGSAAGIAGKILNHYFARLAAPTAPGDAVQGASVPRGQGLQRAGEAGREGGDARSGRPPAGRPQQEQAQVQESALAGN